MKDVFIAVRRTDNVVMMIINKYIVEQIAKIESSISMINLWQKLPSDLEYECFLLAIYAAICHQMTTEFIVAKLRSISKEKFTAGELAKFTEADFYNLVKDYPQQDRLRVKERTELLTDFCKVLVEQFGGSMTGLLKISDYDAEKIEQNLCKAKAFGEDSVGKKRNMLIHALHFQKLANIKNMENANPAIDYHLIRMSLRQGRLDLDNGLLNQKILNNEPITFEEDVTIRTKVAELMKQGAAIAQKGIPEYNWNEFHLARSFCVRGEPKCQTSENPVKDVLKFTFEGKCPFFDVCKKRKEYKLEPNFKSSFY